jgi:sigma-B regulation protein RsbU (phosphoserine phosphatase)
MRAMLDTGSGPGNAATMMDAGLAHIDFDARRVMFSGAKIALYWSDGEQVEQIKGGKRSLGERRQCEYVNEETELDPARTFYLATDGFFDQSGGERGFGFGNARFVDMLRRHARLPLAEQSGAFAAILAEYQGGHAQRDDITMVCFRF